MKPAAAPLLPRALRSVAAAIGEDKTLELVSKIGGTIVYVPKKPTPGAKLVEAIGMVAAKKLAAEMGGEHINLPLAGKAVTFWLKSRGMSNNEIAIAQRISADTVSRRLNGKKVGSLQMDLFAAE